VANVLAEAIERYRAETALRESEERLRTAMEKMPDGVIIVVGGRIIYANPALSEITGYKNSELQNISPVELVCEEDKDRVITRIEQLVKGGKEYPSEYRIVHKSGFAFTIEAYSRRIEFNGMPALLSIIRDISERKRVEEELENYRMQLQNLSAHLQSVREEERTHIAREIHDELGQDLSVLKLNLAWLEKRINENGGQFGDKINFMLRLIDETINKIWEISRKLRPSVLDNLGLSAAIQWQAGTYEKQSDLLSEIIVDCDDVKVSPERTTQLFRIFQECMTNVIRHSKATKVKISLKEEKGNLVLKISDNGVGISREKRYNLKSLGLIGMHERVRSLKGNLKIRGIPNSGTTVIVSIPMENEV
ncbi:MAG: PAS domain S-box protein, partial [Calditrichia bacterium]